MISAFERVSNCLKNSDCSDHQVCIKHSIFVTFHNISYSFHL
ncbi:unnamed protein product [Moneuplotes crassus]|uniref:Uncharacterized protein n=1 Tax=Euplotes crassus TaxID=5936 RepID=A0AAD1XTT2_EUPCR|nr:unnamed protein product [Moneuplotes crassus]